MLNVRSTMVQRPLNDKDKDKDEYEYEDIYPAKIKFLKNSFFVCFLFSPLLDLERRQFHPGAAGQDWDMDLIFEKDRFEARKIAGKMCCVWDCSAGKPLAAGDTKERIGTATNALAVGGSIVGGIAGAKVFAAAPR